MKLKVYSEDVWYPLQNVSLAGNDCFSLYLKSYSEKMFYSVNIWIVHTFLQIHKCNYFSFRVIL